MTGVRAGIRWRPDTGWEARCDSCAKAGGATCYWPLTDEFWIKRQMTRCRACHLTARRIRERARYHADKAYRAALLDQFRQYRAESRRAITVKRRARYAEDPEAARASSRAYYHANREAVLARRRERAA